MCIYPERTQQAQNEMLGELDIDTSKVIRTLLCRDAWEEMVQVNEVGSVLSMRKLEKQKSPDYLLSYNHPPVNNDTVYPNDTFTTYITSNIYILGL